MTTQPTKFLHRPVVPGGAGAPDFGRSVNPISTKGGGGRLCPPNNTGTPGFSDLSTALTFFPTLKMDLVTRKMH